MRRNTARSTSRASQMAGKNLKVKFQAKNLLNPSIQEVYRSEYIGGDVVKTSYRKGITLCLGLEYQF